MLQPDTDVLIIGAGLSGIGMACQLARQRPGTRYAIVEARADLGGTWDLFRYPGVRSDSDLFTFGYDFRPWDSDQALASGPAIKAYIADTAREHGVLPHIRFGHKLLHAHWSSSQQLWTLHVQQLATGAVLQMRARWVFAAAGYYRYDAGHTPAFDGLERFAGRVVHPQAWPEALPWAGQRVVVVGSGATAVTLVPALAREAAHVTMLQRTPSYVLPVPMKDPVASRLRPLLGRRVAHALARRFNIARQRWVYRFCMARPALARRLIRRINQRLLPPGYPVDEHFNPPYNPWEQRLCAVPGGDLFRAIGQGRASVVTGAIAHFTETGITLANGQHLPADLVVTATGLQLQMLGGATWHVDGQPVLPEQAVVYKGMMFSGLPNLAFAIGYTSSSWTLKVGLLCEHFCRLLKHMDRHGLAVCTPVADPAMPTRPVMDFAAGYVQRALHRLPRQGAWFPWASSWNYAEDARMFRRGEVADPHLHFVRRAHQP